MNNPFASNVRRVIPWDQYESLQANQVPRSLTSRTSFTRDEANHRSEALGELEERLGFVYLGERRWLNEWLSGKHVQGYIGWAAEQFLRCFDGGLVPADPDWRVGSRFHWHGYTQDVSFLWLPPSLVPADLDVSYVSVSFPGEVVFPEPERLAHGFEILHNLAYYLFLFGLWAPGALRDCPHGLHDITIPPGSEPWELILISEYGAGWGCQFVGHRIVSPL